MSILQAILLGLLQGLTEFIPVSSSGHLVLVPWLLGWAAPGVAYDTVVHLGTLVAVVLYLRREIIALVRGGWGSLRTLKLETVEARLFWLLIVSAIPGGLMGYLWADFFERLFGSPRVVSLLLMVTGLLLFAGERLGRRSMTLEKMGLGQALVMGLAQGCAIAPGLSRSGATISAGLLCGLKREEAARFSFLMSIPIIAGAAAAQLLKVSSAGLGAPQALHLGLGFVAALASGYMAVRFLLKHLQTHSLGAFSYYCWGIGLVGLALSFVR
jgi:undecaprenyl-diphosphatase